MIQNSHDELLFCPWLEGNRLRKPLTDVHLASRRSVCWLKSIRNASPVRRCLFFISTDLPQAQIFTPDLITDWLDVQVIKGRCSITLAVRKIDDYYATEKWTPYGYWASFDFSDSLISSSRSGWHERSLCSLIKWQLLRLEHNEALS